MCFVCKIIEQTREIKGKKGKVYLLPNIGKKAINEAI
jgi:hypothetical protein